MRERRDKYNVSYSTFGCPIISLSAQPHRQRGALKPAHLQTAVSLCHAALECLCEPTDHRPVGRTPRGETHALGTYSPRRHARWIHTRHHHTPSARAPDACNSDARPRPSHRACTHACRDCARPPTTHHCTTTSGHVTRSARDRHEIGTRWARDGREMGARWARDGREIRSSARGPAPRLPVHCSHVRRHASSRQLEV